MRVYGSLSGAPIRVDASDVLFARKRVEGFTMYEWLETTSLLGQVRVASAAQALLSGPLATEVRARVGLDAFAEAIDGYERAMSGGKVLFLPSGPGA